MTVDLIRDVPLNELRTWDRNPRRITDEAKRRLAKSMTSDPDMLRARPLIALRDGRVIAGNQRLVVANELGWEAIPTVYADLTEQEATTWALRDNNPYGEWDDEGLAQLLLELDQANADLEMTGFGVDEIDAYMSLLSQAPPAEPDPMPSRGLDLALADVSVGDPRHVVEAGQVWRLGGRHVLLCVGVYDDWPIWQEHLAPGSLFVPYPSPTLPLTERAEESALVLVQPDTWLAGHILDKFAAVKGDDAVVLLAPVGAEA